MEEPKENKSMQPSFNKMVKVKINQGRAIQGVGKAGDVLELAADVAHQYERDGYVTILMEAQHG